MKPKVKLLIIRSEWSKEDLEKFLEVRDWFKNEIHIDLSFHEKEYDDYGWATPYEHAGNAITAEWKRDNLSEFNADITAVFIPPEKWMRKGIGGHAPDRETKETIFIKNTKNLEWEVYALIHELLHTFCDLTGQEDPLHSYDTGHKGADGLDDMLPMLDYVEWDSII